MAVFEGVEAGVIVHLPENSSDRLLITTKRHKLGVWCSGIQYSKDTPLTKVTSIQTVNGKYNTKFLLKYEEELNKTLAESEYFDFQVAKQTDAYTPSGCENMPVCKTGEWYLPSQSEAKYIYDNRYMLYNSINNTNFTNGTIVTSTELYGPHCKGIFFNGNGQNGVIGASNKGSEGKYFPMMSIYVR